MILEFSRENLRKRPQKIWSKRLESLIRFWIYKNQWYTIGLSKGLYNTIRYQRDCTIRSDIKGIVHVISSVPLFKEEYECSIKADLNKKKMNKIKLFSRLKTGICFSLLLVYWVKKLSVVIGNRTGPSLMEGILEIMFKSWKKIFRKLF